MKDYESSQIEKYDYIKANIRYKKFLNNCKIFDNNFDSNAQISPNKGDILIFTKVQVFSMVQVTSCIEKMKEIFMGKYTLLGGIIGDLAGSRFEHWPHKSKDFELLVRGDFNIPRGTAFNENGRACYFTDDTVMTVAITRALLSANEDYSNLYELTIKHMKDFGYRYPAAGYGGNFSRWLRSPMVLPYNSFGNGSAMRVAPVAYFAKDIDEVKRLSETVSAVTHNHPEGIKGAEAVAVCIWLALNGSTKQEIKNHIESNYYSLDFDYQELLDTYTFDVTCQGSVPQSIFAFLISEDFEDAIRIAVSMGGDADTMASIAGAIAEAYYGIPEELEKECWEFLTPDIKYVLSKFKDRMNKNN